MGSSPTQPTKFMLSPKAEHITIQFSDIPSRIGYIDKFAQKSDGWLKFLRSDLALLLFDTDLLHTDFLKYIGLDDYSYRVRNADAGRLVIRTSGRGICRIIYGQPGFADFNNEPALKQKRDITDTKLRPYFILGHLTKNDNPFDTV